MCYYTSLWDRLRCSTICWQAANATWREKFGRGVHAGMGVSGSLSEKSIRHGAGPDGFTNIWHSFELVQFHLSICIERGQGDSMMDHARSVKHARISANLIVKDFR